MYESGQLNLLSVLELTNHSLQLLKTERSQVSQAQKPQIGHEQLQEKCQQMVRVLQDLHLIRYTELLSLFRGMHIPQIFRFTETPLDEYLKFFFSLPDRRFQRKGFLRLGITSKSWRLSGTGGGWIPLKVYP